jgi:hypothetical protein
LYSSDNIDIPYNKPLGQAFIGTTQADSLYPTRFAEFRFLGQTEQNGSSLVQCNATVCTPKIRFSQRFTSFNAFYAASPSALALGTFTFVGPDGFVYISLLNGTVQPTGLQIFTPRPMRTALQYLGAVVVNGSSVQYGLAYPEGFYPRPRPAVFVNSTAIIYMSSNSSLWYIRLGFDCSSSGCVFALTTEDRSIVDRARPTAWFYNFQTGTIIQIPGVDWGSNDFGIGGQVTASPYAPHLFVFASRENDVADLFVWNAANLTLQRVNGSRYWGALVFNQGISQAPQISSSNIASFFFNSSLAFSFSLTNVSDSVLLSNLPAQTAPVYSWLGATWWISSAYDLIMLPPGLEQPVNLGYLGFPDPRFANSSFPVSFAFSPSLVNPRWYALVNGTMRTVSTGIGFGPSGPSTPISSDFQYLSACVVSQLGNSSIEQLVLLSVLSNGSFQLGVQAFVQGAPVGNTSDLGVYESLYTVTKDANYDWCYIVSSSGVKAYGGFGTASTIVPQADFVNSYTSGDIVASGPPGDTTTFFIPIQVGSGGLETYYSYSVDVTSCAATARCPFAVQSCIDGQCLPYIAPPALPPVDLSPSFVPTCSPPSPTLTARCTVAGWVIDGNVTVGPGRDVPTLQIPSPTMEAFT